MSETLPLPSALGPEPPPFDMPETEAPAPGRAGDPIVDLLERMQRLSQAVPQAPGDGLGDTVSKLLQRARDPARLDDPQFRTAVAYVVQDWPKFSGSRISLVMPVELRREMADLATTFPGLESIKANGLMQLTPVLKDRTLIKDIRETARQVASADTGAAQVTPALTEALSALELRALQARSPDLTAARIAAAEPAAQASAPAASARIKASASPGDGEAQRPPDESSLPELLSATQPSNATVAAAGSVASPTASAAGSKVVRDGPSYLSKQLDAFSIRIDEAKTAGIAGQAERAGEAALKAMEAFTQGPARDLTHKMEKAAEAEPDGIQGVLREMQPGGRHAALRTEFDALAKSNQEFAKGYEAVRASTVKYGKTRLDVQDNLRARGLAPDSMDDKFQKVDAKVGEGAAKIPGEEPGKSLIEELAAKFAELLQRAIQAVAAGIRRGLNARSDAGPSPAP